MLDLALVLVVAVVIGALAFDFINGFHDTANAIATVVSTRVLPVRAAILMAAGLNFLGALYSTEVADTIASGLVEPDEVTQPVVLAAVLGAIAWQIITWKYGIPSSSSHALIGGLCGAAMVHRGAGVVLWDGVTHKVLLPLVASPVAGFAIAFVIMVLIVLLFGAMHPRRLNKLFQRVQVATAAGMAFAHGSNDAQKSMGIITLALVSYGALAAPPAHLDSERHIPLWVVLSCATAMALGTATGGHRIIKTMGHKIIRLEPVHGAAAESSASIVILAASHLGMPVSTTHVICGSIFGVGASKRLNAVRWGVARDMVVAWVLTLPAAGLVSATVYLLLTLPSV